MKVVVKNIFDNVSQAAGAQEEYSTLFGNSAVKIERIVSYHHSSPAGIWYDQSGDEWVIVLRGSATLEFEGRKFVEMIAGDYLEIPRHVKHRVARTGDETIWLAVHSK
jgi:cupin 2 domain-containing protein